MPETPKKRRKIFGNEDEMEEYMKWQCTECATRVNPRDTRWRYNWILEIWQHKCKFQDETYYNATKVE